ncbi:uncharacterized protein SCODWIG_02936 [Saccharomycodes ludwigii]|uniref:ER membrane protein complex subunit 2 n=1 Tax=Saccharomycodes ludwigii TaxID=36035 RepID=A0A376B934_9ASCO|nr:hypothetical protein SCDLUD_000107 [Saccharomycodes ludwigii]KAH3902528.1 hypothetical protein SCDLUD_000107 [Saccharomycodes ludwigii]SSD61175.1 uncharacterized protein SCODWIG_02936 [Saccharomycodes ludwigii]
MSIPLKEKLISIATTGYYAQLDPKQIEETYHELKTYLKFSTGLTNMEYFQLLDLLLILCLYKGRDTEAEFLYKALCDKFGEDSPFLHYYRSLLHEIGNINNPDVEDTTPVEKDIENLISTHLEVETDNVDYLLMSKRYLMLKKRGCSIQTWLRLCFGLLEKFPMDAELWYSCALEYFKLELYDQAIYCFEEVVMLTPFNYVALGSLGEALYYKYKSNTTTITNKNNNNLAETIYVLQEALDRFLKSVELSENYMKSWCFIAIICKEILDLSNNDKKYSKKRELLDLAKRQLQKTDIMNESDKTACKLVLSNI